MRRSAPSRAPDEEQALERELRTARCDTQLGQFGQSRKVGQNFENAVTMLIPTQTRFAIVSDGNPRRARV